MKRILTLLLAIMMLSGSAVAETTAIPAYDEMTVGVFTAPTGAFFTDLWGTNTTDMDIRILLHGYDLMYWDQQSSAYIIDPEVVSGMTVSENAEGDRTYTMALYDDLYYSDGTRITAKDYAFTVLLCASPAIRELGVTPAYAWIKGAQDYTSGASGLITGVRVLDDSLLSITVSGAYRPYFFEQALLDIIPYPASVLAPGVQVTDDGEGVSLSSALTADQLRATILDPVHGYLTHPSVVSGPYTLTAYDAEQGTAAFTVNPYYKGTANGAKPTITTVKLMTVTHDQSVELLADGTLTLVNKLTNSAAIDAALALTSREDLTQSNYMRSGLTLLSFCCERDGVSDRNVRRAIAMCFDRQQFMTETVGNYGMLADGYYGLGQWQYRIASGILTPDEDEGKANDWRRVSLTGLTPIECDPAAAAKLLESDGWKLNADGIREREGVKLDLTLICSGSDALTASFERTLGETLRQAGIRLTIKNVSASELLAQYYRSTDRACDMIYVGTNFPLVFDPSRTYDTSDAAQGAANRTGLRDPWLEQLANEMMHTETGDLYTYMKRWVSFEEYWTEVLPAVPVYTNVYFDCYSNTLHGYNINTGISWSQAILSAWLSDYTDVEAADPGDDVEFFD